MIKPHLILFLDPFELQNRVDQLKPEERLYLHKRLMSLMACKGQSCTLTHNHAVHGSQKARASSLPIHTVVPQPQRYRKRKVLDEFGNGKEQNNFNSVLVVIS